MATSYLSFLIYSLGGRSIKSQAQTNITKSIKEAKRSLDTQVTKRISPLAPGPGASHIKGRSSRPLPSLPFSANSLSSKPEYNSTNEQQIGVDLKGLIQSGNFTLKVIGLRKLGNDFDDDSFSSFGLVRELRNDFDDDSFFSLDSESLFTLDLQLKADATVVEIMAAIKDAGGSLIIFPCFLHI